MSFERPKVTVDREYSTDTLSEAEIDLLRKSEVIWKSGHNEFIEFPRERKGTVGTPNRTDTPLFMAVWTVIAEKHSFDIDTVGGHPDGLPSIMVKRIQRTR